MPRRNRHTAPGRLRHRRGLILGGLSSILAPLIAGMVGHGSPSLGIVSVPRAKALRSATCSLVEMGRIDTDGRLERCLELATFVLALFDRHRGETVPDFIELTGTQKVALREFVAPLFTRWNLSLDEDIRLGCLSFWSDFLASALVELDGFTAGIL